MPASRRSDHCTTITWSSTDARRHAAAPRRFDKTVEYAARYHQAYLPAMLARPFVVGGAVWNLADFSSGTRQEANPHLNTKGLLTAERQPKAPYYYYQTQLSTAPLVRIGSRDWTLRAGVAAGPDSLVCPQLVEVYTNQPAARLRLNGRDLGPRPAVGNERSFVDEQLRQVWLPEQPYVPGGWGYVGGHAYKLPSERLPYGSDRDVLGTDLDAVYETQRLGLTQFRLDVPDGEYELILHLAELEAAPAASSCQWPAGAARAGRRGATAPAGHQPPGAGVGARQAGHRAHV